MRAYAELESAGLVTSRRGGGTTVADAPLMLSPEEREHSLASQAAAFVARARLLGVPDRAIDEAVHSALSSKPDDPGVSRRRPFGRREPSRPG